MTENGERDNSFKQITDDVTEAEKETQHLEDSHSSHEKEKDESKELLEKERQKSLRLLADYQNLEKQIIDRINTRGDKIILDFLTVYEDFIRTKIGRASCRERV